MPDASSPAIVQRLVGLEIESNADWSAFDTEHNLIAGEHKTLLESGKIRLETELSGKLEFVVEPPAETTKELVDLVLKIQGIVSDLVRFKPDRQKQMVHNSFALGFFMKQLNLTKEEVLTDPHYRAEVNKPVDLIDAEKRLQSSKAAGVFISHGGNFDGSFQATAGINLAGIPMLFEVLRNGDLNFDDANNKLEKAEGEAASAREASVGLPLNGYRQISPQMEGFIALVLYYLVAGDLHRQREPFPKGIMKVMAKTDFATMFAMTPEASVFSANPEVWVRLVCEAAKLDPSLPIFRAPFGDTPADSVAIDITRGDWLRAMVGGDGKPAADLLSVDRGDERERGPEILKTMGSIDKTDDLGVEGAGNRGVILELRGLELATKPFATWAEYAQSIGDMVDQVNALTEDRTEGHADVLKEGRTSELTWASPEFEDVQALSIEAMYAPFKAQVGGLVARARSRAKAALKDD